MDGKKKKDLWPIIKKYVHPLTSVICSDQAKQYHGVSNLFPEIIHKTVNHKIEFVDPTDNTNHINSIESQNKQFKRNLLCRRTPKFLAQYMALYYYRRTKLNVLGSNGEKVEQFLKDISKVYPGPLSDGLKLNEIKLPTPEEMGIENLMPKYSARKIDPLEEVNYEDMDDDEDWEEF